MEYIKIKSSVQRLRDFNTSVLSVFLEFCEDDIAVALLARDLGLLSDFICMWYREYIVERGVLAIIVAPNIGLHATKFCMGVIILLRARLSVYIYFDCQDSQMVVVVFARESTSLAQDNKHFFYFSVIANSVRLILPLGIVLLYRKS